MKCAKCGNELPEGAKFCGNCGNTIDAIEPQSTESVEPSEVVENSIVEDAQAFETVEAPVVEDAQAFESVESTTTEPSFTSEVSNEPERQPIVTKELPFDKPEFKENQEKSKKASKAVKWIITIFAVLLVLAALVFAYFKFFDKESYSKSINTMEKAVDNLIKDKNASGRIDAKLFLSMKEEGMKDSIDFNISAYAEYEKQDNSYKMHLVVNPFMIIEKMEAYLLIDNSSLKLYASESTIETILSYVADTESVNDASSSKWYKLTLPLDSLDIDLSELNLDEEIDIDLEKIFTEDNFKYVGRKGLSTKHYVLTVDKKFISNMMEQYDVMDELDTESIDLDDLGDFSFDIDFYVKNDELTKIEIDLGKALKDELKGSGVSELVFTLEFSGRNSTKVNVSNEIESNCTDLTDMIFGTIGMIEDANDSAKERTAELTYSSIQLAYTSAMMDASGAEPTLEQIKAKVSVDGATVGEINGNTFMVTTNSVYCEVNKSTDVTVKCGTTPGSDDLLQQKSIK